MDITQQTESKACKSPHISLEQCENVWTATRERAARLGKIHTFSLNNSKMYGLSLFLAKTRLQNLGKLVNGEWVFLNYTVSPYDILKEDEQSNSQMVIGQEFDDVIVYLDESFYYDDEGKLCSYDHHGGHYRNVKMLYQNMTRAKRQLKLIIINNESVFAQCVGILGRNLSQ